MKQENTTRFMLVYIGLLMFFISFMLLLISGVSPGTALLWNILSSLQVNFQLLPIAFESSPLVPIVGVINAFVFAIWAAAFATMFFDMIKRFRMSRILGLSKIRNLENHVVLAPANSFAEYVANELAQINVKSVAIAEREHDAFHFARRKHMAVIGSPKSQESFEIAGAKRAIYVVACDEDDVQNALITVAAKSANPRIRVISRINDVDSIPKLGMVGVYRTIMPEITTGVAIGSELAKQFMKQPQK